MLWQPLFSSPTNRTPGDHITEYALKVAPPLDAVSSLSSRPTQFQWVPPVLSHLVFAVTELRNRANFCAVTPLQNVRHRLVERAVLRQTLICRNTAPSGVFSIVRSASKVCAATLLRNAVQRLLDTFQQISCYSSSVPW